MTSDPDSFEAARENMAPVVQSCLVIPERSNWGSANRRTLVKERNVETIKMEVDAAEDVAGIHDDNDNDDVAVGGGVNGDPHPTHASEKAVSSSKKPRLDSVSKERGKRFMGVLLGTLSKFKSDSAKSASKDEHKRQVEAQVAEKLLSGREEIQKAMRLEAMKRSIASLSRRIETENSSIEQLKSDLLSIHESQCCFLKTKAGPSLFFLPAILTEEQEGTIQKQKDSMQESWLKRLHKLTENLERLKTEKSKLEESCSSLSCPSAAASESLPQSHNSPDPAMDVDFEKPKGIIKNND